MEETIIQLQKGYGSEFGYIILNSSRIHIETVSDPAIRKANWVSAITWQKAEQMRTMQQNWSDPIDVSPGVRETDPHSNDDSIQRHETMKL